MVVGTLVLAGVVYRVADRWRLGRDPLRLEPDPAGPGYRVDVNRAGWAELALVPGLGETLSRRIVALRQARGRPFETLEELLAVDGIGETILAKLRPYLTLGDPAADPPDPDEPIDLLNAP